MKSRRRVDGDRPHVQGGVPEGAARARDRAAGLGRSAPRLIDDRLADDIDRDAARRAAPADAGAHLPGQARARARAVGRRAVRAHGDRSVVPRRRCRSWSRRSVRTRRSARSTRHELRAHEADGLLRSRSSARCAARREERGARAALGAGRPAGVQDGRHLRRRVSVGDAVSLRQLRRGERGAAQRTASRS